MKSGSDLSLMLYQLYQLQWDPVQDQDRECAVQWDPLQEDRECCCQVVQQQTQTIAENMKFKKFKLSERVGGGGEAYLGILPIFSLFF